VIIAFDESGAFNPLTSIKLSIVLESSIIDDSCLLQTRFIPLIKLQIGHGLVVEHSGYLY